MRPASEGLVSRLRASGVVHAEEEAALLLAEHPDVTALEDAVARRVAGEPLEVVLGWAAFAGRRIGVAPGVFVPRLRTTLLARLAVDRLPAEGAAVELCCGAGAVAVVLVEERPAARVVASDVDPVATACAARNLAGRGLVVTGDLDAGLPDDLAGAVDVLVANAPYVPSDAVALMPREAREHEPRAALDGGEDGVAVHRRLALVAPRWLRAGGALLVETSPRQAPLTTAAMEAAGLSAEVVLDDDVDGCVAVGTLGPARGSGPRPGEPGS